MHVHYSSVSLLRSTSVTRAHVRLKVPRTAYADRVLASKCLCGLCLVISLPGFQ